MSRCVSPALSPLPLIFSYKSEKVLVRSRFGALKDGMFGPKVDAKLKQAQQKADEEFIQDKAVLTGVRP